MDICWKSDEMKLCLLSKGWKSQRDMGVTPGAGAPNATKHLQVFASRWAHITRRALDHFCRLSTFSGCVVASSVLMCFFTTPFITVLTSKQHISCTATKFCPVPLTFSLGLTVGSIERHFLHVATGLGWFQAPRRAGHHITAHCAWPGISIFTETAAAILTTGLADWSQTDREIPWEW